MMAAWSLGPPVWFKWVSRALAVLVSVVIALVVIIQWAVWVVLGLELGGPILAFVLGCVIPSLQVVMIFDDGSSENRWWPFKR